LGIGFVLVEANDEFFQANAELQNHVVEQVGGNKTGERTTRYDSV
jgi:hypothetical protein